MAHQYQDQASGLLANGDRANKTTRQQGYRGSFHVAGGHSKPKLFVHGHGPSSQTHLQRWLFDASVGGAMNLEIRQATVGHEENMKAYDVECEIGNQKGSASKAIWYFETTK